MKAGSSFGPAILLFLLTLSASAQNDLRQLYADAQRAQAAGDLATATRKYEAIVKLEPKMAEAYANLGNLYYQQGQTERAKAAYRKAIGQKPEMVGPQFFLGVMAFSEHDYTTALDHLEKAANGDSPNGLVHAYLGYTRFARSEFGEAAASLEKANGMNRNDVDVLYHLSKSYGHLADGAFAQLESSFPGSLYVLLVRGQLAESKEDWTDAAKQYGLALRKMPDNQRLRAKADWTAAMALGKTARPPEGTRDEVVDGSLIYKDATLSGPKLKEDIAERQSALSTLNSGEKSDRTWYLQGEDYQILAYLASMEVFDLDPDSYRSHQLRAQMLEASNNDDGAIQEYREALKRKPDLQNIHFAIGSLLWKDQHMDNAREELQLELKINPHHPQALYELGDICAFKGQTSEAERHLLEAIKLQPSMADAHYALEKVYTGAGRYDKSIEQLQDVLRLNGRDPTAHYRLAMVYRKLGNNTGAEHELALFYRFRSNHNGSSTVK